MMRNFFIMICSMFIVMSSDTAKSQSLGRLFTTVEERAALEKKREKYKPGERIAEEKTEPAQLIEEQTPANVTLNGFVKRSSGKNTTWINQEPIEVQTTSQNIKVQQQPLKQPLMSVTSSTGKRYQLKAGQTIEGGSGKVKEVFEPVTEVKNVKPEVKD